MARVKLDFPQKPVFITEIPVRITDINYGGHLGNDSLLTLLHEARVRFLANFGFKETDIDGVGMIMTDAVLRYKAEVFYGNVLKIEIGVHDLHSHGADITYRVFVGDREAAKAKTGFVFYDYASRKIMRTPEAFSRMFGPSTPQAEQ